MYCQMLTVHIHRETLWNSLSQYTEKKGKNPEFLAHRGPKPFCLQWNDKNKRVFFALTQSTIVVLIPYRFLLRQEGIKTNLEQKNVEIFFWGI